MAELQNANPTIINLSELPTRRRQKGAAQLGSDELNAFSPRPPRWDQPSPDVFGGYGTESDQSTSDSGDPIDEQEIFGTHSGVSFSMFSWLFEANIAYQPCGSHSDDM